MDLSNVRIREHFGLVSNDTHTDKFSFLVSPPKNRPSVEKNDYVLLDHPLFGETCQVLAEITDIAAYEEIAGGSTSDRLGKMLATAEIIGYINLNNEAKPLHKVLVPPNPGCRIYVPTQKFLENILNRNIKGEAFKRPIEIGIFDTTSAEQIGDGGNIKCFIDLLDFTSKHTIVTAMAEAGKTSLVKQLIEAISNNLQIQTLVFDNYNEYSGLHQSKTTELNRNQEALIKEIKNGQLINLTSQAMTTEERKTFYEETLKLLLKLRLEEKIKPILLVIEEAENLKGAILNQVIAAGRKRGIAILLLTTHPSELGGKILSQTGNQIIGKTIDNQDIDFLKNIIGNANSLPMLMANEWIINGINANRPMKIRTKIDING
jgi:DNA helicase HerA-like ATPase